MSSTQSVSQKSQALSKTGGELESDLVYQVDQIALRKKMSRWQWIGFHLIVFFGAAISGYDVSNIATIQVPIYRTFGQIDLLPWVTTAFSLGNGAMSPLANQIMKLVDLKWFTLSVWFLFLIASAVVGASPTINGVIVGRVILGIAGGGMYLSLITYINLLARPTEHPKINGLLGMGFAIGLIVGPIIGGAFAENEHATWRWAFYLCVPYAALIMALIYLVLPNVRVRPQRTVLAGLRAIDWLGAFLHISTLVLFDAACIFSGSILPWNSGVIAVWVMSGVCLIAYIIQQRFSVFVAPSERILPTAVMSSRLGALVLIATAMSSTGYGVALYYLPLFYAFTRGDDAIQTATHMLPYICVYIAGALGTGMLLPKIRRYAPIYLIAGLLITAGSAAMQSVNERSSLSQSMGISAIVGLGVGSTLQLGATVLNLGLPRSTRMDSGIAMTITIYACLTIALAVAGCVFQNIGFIFLANALQETPLSDDQIRGALAGVAAPELRSALSPVLQAAAISALTSAVLRIFYVVTAGGIIMAISAMLMRWEALDFSPVQTTSEKE